MSEVGSVACVGFLVESGACVLVSGAGSCPSRATSGGMFWGVCELSMILGSLSAIGGIVFLSC